MKSPKWLLSFAFVLSCVPLSARADDPPPATLAERRVQDGLLKPLAEMERNTSRFSRARPVPHERRVRVTQATPTIDKAGRPFMAFALDVKFAGGEWRENDVVGCAYIKSADLFVKIGDDYRPASFLLGKDAGAVPGVCQAAPART